MLKKFKGVDFKLIWVSYMGHFLWGNFERVPLKAFFWGTYYIDSNVEINMIDPKDHIKEGSYIALTEVVHVRPYNYKTLDSQQET